MTVEAEASALLVTWFRREARELPWRGVGRSPYRVLVSELMLQQTQVERVVPLFQAFVQRFPTIEALASAPLEEVLESWSGLGYYRRARFLHRAAQTVAAQGGHLPRERSELERLPGVGPYTAAAVASLAFGQPEPVLDGNVIRVGTRWLAFSGDPRREEGSRRLRQWALSLMEPHDHPGEINEALMELGATVCLPHGPRCGRCPLAAGCAARREGRPEAFPAPRLTRPVEEHCWVAACCIDAQGRWLLTRIDDGPVLRGLWLPPLERSGNPESPVEQALRCLPSGERGEGRPCSLVRHSITYRRISVIPVRFEGSGRPFPDDSWRWARPDTPGLPTSSLLKKLARKVEEGCQAPAHRRKAVTHCPDVSATR